MSLYSKTYAFVLKKNFMLLIIAIVLLFFTFAFWFVFPIFALESILEKLNAPIFIQIICSIISIGIFFSLFFIPINLKVAKMVGEMKQESTTRAFIRLHSAFILLSAIVICLIFSLFIWIQ